MHLHGKGLGTSHMNSYDRYEALMDVEWFKEYLEKNLEPLLRPEADKFRTLDDPLPVLHHTLGRYIRNNWGFWDVNQKTELKAWFSNLGINHPDDMSSICIETYHRMVNAKPIDLENQINLYKIFWKEHGFADGIYRFEEDT